MSGDPGCDLGCDLGFHRGEIAVSYAPENLDLLGVCTSTKRVLGGLGGRFASRWYFARETADLAPEKAGRLQGEGTETRRLGEEEG
eukprot:5955946-Pleurochrysis_carterae.AAC.1